MVSSKYREAILIRAKNDRKGKSLAASLVAYYIVKLNYFLFVR
jgi:hypothetical protein